MPVICGCGLSFKASGLWNHQRQSQDFRCKDHKDDRDFDSNDLDLDPHDIINNILEKIPGATVDLDQIDVDPTGDYFSDYNAYDDMEVENPVEKLTTTDEEDSDSDDNFNNLTMEIFEPERQPHSSETHSLAPENQVDEAPEDSSAKEKATWLRGGAEIELRKQPFIVKFPNGRAGAVHAEQVVDEIWMLHILVKLGVPKTRSFPFRPNWNGKSLDGLKCEGQALQHLQN